MTALDDHVALDAVLTTELSVPVVPRQRGAGRHGTPARSGRPPGGHRAPAGGRIPAQRGTAERAPRYGASRDEDLPGLDDLPGLGVRPDLDIRPEPAPPVRRRPRSAVHRVPRRPAGLLAALVAGGLVAGWLTLPGETPVADEPTSVAEAQQLLSTEEDTELAPMASISVAEAQARLEEVAASRAEREAKAAAEAAAAAAAAAEAARPKTVLPVKGARLTSTFGPRWGSFHYGIDLAAPMHTPEYAAADGVVLRAGAASGYGLVVEILHETGEVTVYGHMDAILVAPGDYVQAGDRIALLGNRGQSTGPHLHFEVHRSEGGQRIDPIAWLASRGVHL